MSFTFRKVRIPIGLVSQNATTKLLVVPSAATVYLADKTTVATIYSDETGAALTNPVPTGVADGAAGIDTVGNLVFYGDIGTDYYVLLNGHFEPVPATGVHGDDFKEHLDGTVPDPHADRAYADTNKIDKTSAGVADGVATLDDSGLVTSTQMVCR